MYPKLVNPYFYPIKYFIASTNHIQTSHTCLHPPHTNLSHLSTSTTYKPLTSVYTHHIQTSHTCLHPPHTNLSPHLHPPHTNLSHLSTPTTYKPLTPVYTHHIQTSHTCLHPPHTNLSHLSRSRSLSTVESNVSNSGCDRRRDTGALFK